MHTFLLAGIVACSIGSPLQSNHWQAAVAHGQLSSLRCDPSGRSRYGRELLYLPLAIRGISGPVTLRPDDVRIGSGGREVVVSLPAAEGLTLAWPVDLGPDGFYDRLSEQTIRADRPDHPALLRFVGLATGHTLVIEAFKRMSRVPGLPGIRNDAGSTIGLQTADGAEIVLDAGPGAAAQFAFEMGRLVMRVPIHGRRVALRFAQPGPGVALETGRLPSFSFGRDVEVRNSLASKTTLNRLLNEFALQAGYWYPSGTGLTLWGEWGALGHAYVDGPYRQDVFNPLCGQVVGDDGYGRDGLAWSWGDERGWPFPGGYDTRHLDVNAIQICAIRQYLLWTGERERARGRDFGLRLLAGTRSLLAQDEAGSSVRLVAASVYSQTFTASAAFDTVALNVRVPHTDPIFGTASVTSHPAHATKVAKWTPVGVASVPGRSVAQVLIPARPFNTLGVSTPTWASTQSGGRLRLFRWTGDYTASTGAAPLGEVLVPILRDNVPAWVHAPGTLPGGTAVLLVLDEPTTASATDPPRTGVWSTEEGAGSPELGPAFRGGEPWSGVTLMTHVGTRWNPQIEASLCDASGAVVWRTAAPAALAEGQSWQALGLGKRVPAGRYRLDVRASDAGIEWLSSQTPTRLGGTAAVDGHTWDWLDRARRMMAYQLEWLNGRAENVLKLDEKCGDRDHLGLNGKSVGNNYYDILPFGYYDAYAGAWFYRSLVAMAEIEQAYGDERRAAEYRRMASDCARRYNELFWTASGNRDGAARYIGCIDAEGKRHDLGFTFVNLLAVASGLAPKERAEAVLRWLDTGVTIDGQGRRTQDDIYKWAFGPRCTTIDNKEWWPVQQNASAYPWGDQIQNGGADLYESYYDLVARLRTRGGDDGYKRFLGIMRRYAEPDRLTGGGPLFDGGSVQGGGTAGGAGVMSFEFPETAMLAGVVLHGFLGAEARADGLHLRPRLPREQPWVEARDILYHGTRFTIRASHSQVNVMASATGRRYRFGGKTLKAPFTATVGLGASGEVVLAAARQDHGT